jgi:hypothetical protein
LTVPKEHEDISGPVIIDVDNRPRLFPRIGVEFLHKVRPAVEVSIDLSTDELVMFVVFLNVWLPVEVRVDVDFSKVATIIEAKPDIGAVVAVAILGLEMFGRGIHRQHRNRGAHTDTKCGDPLGRQKLHELFRISAIFRALQAVTERITRDHDARIAHPYARRPRRTARTPTSRGVVSGA